MNIAQNEACMKYRLASLILIPLTNLTVGCASLRDTRQTLPVACNTPSCQVRIQPDNITLQAPKMVDIERDSEVQLLYKYGEQTQKKTLKGKVRWGESVLPNTLLVLMGPAGWAIAAAGLAIDFGTGNMWELPTPPVAKFKSSEEFAPIQKIVIAPVLANTQLESDEAAQVILESLKKEFPQAQIHLPEDFNNEFSRSDWNYGERPKDNWKRFELYAALNTDHIVFAEVKTGNSSQRLVQFELRDVLRQKSLAKSERIYTSLYQNQKTFTWIKSKMIELIPNSVAISRTSSVAVGVGITNDPVKETDGGIQSDTYSIKSNDSSSGSFGISFSNLEQDFGRRFHFVAKWATEASVRYSKIQIEKNTIKDSWNAQMMAYDTDYSNSQVDRVDQYFAASMIGYEVGVAGALGYVYLNALAGPELLHARFSSKESSISEVYIPVKSGLGYRIEAGDSFQFGFETSYRQQPPWVSERILKHATGEQMNRTGSAELRFSMSLAYYFPEMRTFARKKTRDWVAN